MTTLKEDDASKSLKRDMQKLFDQAWQGLKAQGQASGDFQKTGGIYDPNEPPSCFYRMKNGDITYKCGIGQMITDEQIARSGLMEGQTPRDFPIGLLGEMFPSQLNSLGQYEPTEADTYAIVDFLDGIQEAHDHSAHLFGAEFWKSYMVQANDLVAVQFELTPIPE